MAACHFDRFDGIALPPKRGLSDRTEGDGAGVGEFALLPHYRDVMVLQNLSPLDTNLL